MGYKIGVVIGAALIVILSLLNAAGFWAYKQLKNSPAAAVDLREVYGNYVGDMKD